MTRSAPVEQPHPFDPYSEEAPEFCGHCGQPADAPIHPQEDDSDA